MLQRDMQTKRAPARFQDEAKPSEFDIIICFEQRIFDAVVEGALRALRRALRAAPSRSLSTSDRSGRPFTFRLSSGSHTSFATRTRRVAVQHSSWSPAKRGGAAQLAAAGPPPRASIHVVTRRLRVCVISACHGRLPASHRQTSQPATPTSLRRSMWSILTSRTTRTPLPRGRVLPSNSCKPYGAANPAGAAPTAATHTHCAVAVREAHRPRLRDRLRHPGSNGVVGARAAVLYAPLVASTVHLHSRRGGRSPTMQQRITDALDRLAPRHSRGHHRSSSCCAGPFVGPIAYIPTLKANHGL